MLFTLLLFCSLFLTIADWNRVSHAIKQAPCWAYLTLSQDFQTLHQAVGFFLKLQNLIRVFKKLDRLMDQQKVLRIFENLVWKSNLPTRNESPKILTQLRYLLSIEKSFILSNCLSFLYTFLLFFFRY